MTRQNTYNRLARLDLLTSRLKSDELLTIGMLATEFGVSRRTLSRDISILRDKGLPIETDTGRGGGVRLHHSWGVGRLTLNYQESIELLISIAIAERFETPWMFMNATSIRHKLIASFSSKMRSRIKGLRQRIHVGETTSVQIFSSFNPPQPDCMAAIFQAFLEMHKLKITYLDAEENHSERYIEAHHLLLCNPVWYLYAWDAEKQAVRCFRCDRIKTATVSETPFTERPYHHFESQITKMGAAPI